MAISKIECLRSNINEEVTNPPPPAKKSERRCGVNNAGGLSKVRKSERGMVDTPRSKLMTA